MSKKPNNPQPDETGHIGGYVKTLAGNVAHVRGKPGLFNDKRALAMLNEVIDKACEEEDDKLNKTKSQ